MRGNYGNLRFAIYTVSAVDTITKKCTLTIASTGQTVDYPGTLAPQVGDKAWCIVDGSYIRPVAFDR